MPSKYKLAWCIVVNSYILFQQLVSVSALGERYVSFGQCAEYVSPTSEEGQVRRIGMVNEQRCMDFSQEPLIKPMVNAEYVNRVKVEPSCKVIICPGKYLTGKCVSFDQGFHAGPSFNVMSAHCLCYNNCNSHEGHLKKATCFRAFLRSNGTACSSRPYIDFFKSENFQEMPVQYGDNIDSIYVQEKRQVRLIFADGRAERQYPYVGTLIAKVPARRVEAYMCKPRATKAVDPAPIKIPDDINKVLSKLNKQIHHWGLNEAKKALDRGRSARNSYMLLLGSENSDKEETINQLFNNIILDNSTQDLAKEDISEYRVSVPLDSFRMSNSQLRIINTPSFTQSNSVTNFAQIKHYLQSHRDLQGKFLNAIVIFYPYNNVPNHLENSVFVQILQGLAILREDVLDGRTNVVFILTRMCSATTTDQRNPTRILEEFKTAIKKYGDVAFPLYISVAESRLNMCGIEEQQGYYELPNKELYPKNLLETFKKMFSKGGDHLAREIFETAFHHLENANVTRYIRE